MGDREWNPSNRRANTPSEESKDETAEVDRWNRWYNSINQVNFPSEESKSPEQDVVAARGRGGIARNTGLPIQRLMSIHELRQRFTEVPLPINAETILPDISRLIVGRRYIISNQEGSPQYHIIYRGPGRINGSRQYVVCTVEWSSLAGNPQDWNDYVYIENGNLVFELPQNQNGGKLKKSRKNKKNRKNKKSRKGRKSRKSKK